MTVADAASIEDLASGRVSRKNRPPGDQDVAVGHSRAFAEVVDAVIGADQLVDVARVSGVGFGEEGEGYVRLALVENEQRLRQAARGIKAMLAKG